MNRFRWLFRRRTNVDLAREVDAHIAERVDELVEDGLSETDARTQARREFGNATLEIERSREVWIAPWLSSVWQDLRYAVRSLVRQPGFTLSAVGILAIGIGLVTTFLALMNGVALRPWTVSDPGSLAVIVPHRAPGGAHWNQLSSPEYHYIREHARSVTHLVAWGSSRHDSVEHGGNETRVGVEGITANYFDALQVRIVRGRSFLPDEEDHVSPKEVAIISERLWRDHFGAADGLPGQPILIGGRPYTVVGIAGDGFRGVDMSVDLWIPLPSTLLPLLARDPDALQILSDHTAPNAQRWRVFGRLAHGVDRETAEAELSVLGTQFRSSLGLESNGFTLLDTRPISLDPEMLSRHGMVYGLQFGALFLVMLLACANVGNLLLARGLSRQREIAIRLSIGASRARVVRQLITESLLVSMAAGAVGLWMASLAPSVIQRFTPSSDRFAPDGFVLACASAMAVIACLASGLMPALRITKIGLATRANERHAGRAGTGRLRTFLLATQVALSMALLVGAGLLTRAIGEVAVFDPGFAIHETQAFELRLPEGATSERRSVFARTLRDSLATADFPPLAFSDFPAIVDSAMYVPLRPDGAARDAARSVIVRPVSTEYFSVLRIPIVAGRSLSDDGGIEEVVVNESAARLLWPSGGALGRALISGNRDGYERPHHVVGVVKDVPTMSVDHTGPIAYWAPSAYRILLVRNGSQSVANRVVSVARGIEPDAQVTARPLADDMLRSVDGLVDGSRFAWAIGALALLLATIGAFGVFAYTVEERRREIGVRMALGARSRQVVWTVVGGARRPLIFGLGAGLLLSLATTPLLGHFLYGLSPFDPITYLGIAAILVAAALVATWIPARRATRIDPAVTLRGD